MVNIKGNGVPSRKTTGSIGDIYTDISTGDQYRCTFAYCDSSKSECDYEWKKLYNKVKFETEKQINGEIDKKPEKQTSAAIHQNKAVVYAQTNSKHDKTTRD